MQVGVPVEVQVEYKERRRSRRRRRRRRRRRKEGRRKRNLRTQNRGSGKKENTSPLKVREPTEGPQGQLGPPRPPLDLGATLRDPNPKNPGHRYGIPGGSPRPRDPANGIPLGHPPRDPCVPCIPWNAMGFHGLHGIPSVSYTHLTLPTTPYV